LRLLRKLSQIQHDRGFIDDESLLEISSSVKVPLYHLEGLVSFYTYFRRVPPARVSIQICRDIACKMASHQTVSEKIQKEYGSRNDIEISFTSCTGRCDSALSVLVNDQPVAIQNEKDWQDFQSFVEEPDSLKINLPTDPLRWKCNPYQNQDDWYSTFINLLEEKSLTEFSHYCIKNIEESGLRGMGGAGFPTGKKWQMVADENAEFKTVICNADESEPGTFKDRVILKDLSHMVIEGMIIAGLSVGAEKGIVFLRHAYAPEQRILEQAIEQARKKGLLGQNILGTGKNYDIEIFVSPGGYILGEETALMEALEDRRGEPRNKPPYPVQEGYLGKPTLINNVETYALAASIVHHSLEWWQEQGEGDYSGLKFIPVSGDVNSPGVYEVPWGTTFREIIEKAGGMKNDKPLQAFLPGGASSNFLCEADLDLPLDFDAVRNAGSMLGTGAIITFNEDRNLLEMGQNITEFFRNESCGKCVPCRVGCEKGANLVNQISNQQNLKDVLPVLEEISETMQQTSICGLGQVALNPVMSVLKNFPGKVL
jgi:NADH:ubiquinone oxidoreductase subunit F (NADH-binding)/NADH:ubiquinone oxidoreductase subunit E